MTTKEIVILIIIAALILLFTILLILKNPVETFEPLHFYLDISDKKGKSDDEYVDMLILQNPDIIDFCDKQFNSYKKYIDSMKAKYMKSKFRLKQVEKSYKSLDYFLNIHITRNQARYQQINYEKYKYDVTVTVNDFKIHYDELISFLMN